MAKKRPKIRKSETIAATDSAPEPEEIGTTEVVAANETTAAVEANETEKVSVVGDPVADPESPELPGVPEVPEEVADPQPAPLSIPFSLRRLPIEQLSYGGLAKGWSVIDAVNAGFDQYLQQTGKRAIGVYLRHTRLSTILRESGRGRPRLIEKSQQRFAGELVAALGHEGEEISLRIGLHPGDDDVLVVWGEGFAHPTLYRWEIKAPAPEV